MKIANIAQIVNAISPLQTQGDALLVQSTYHAFAMFGAGAGAWRCAPLSTDRG